MLFSSIVFLFYFLPVTLIVYVLCGSSRMMQNIWLLIVSLFFYAWGEPIFVLFMILSIVVNWYFGVLVDRHAGVAGKVRNIMIMAVAFNIGVLFICKYLAFFVANINIVLGFEAIHFAGFPLPLGISFFTFQALSYVIDVHWGIAKVERSPFYVGLYISLFPQLVAGPIVRYADVAEQLRTRTASLDKFSSGCSRFVFGLAKKIVIANAMGAVSDRVFELSAAGNHIVFVPALLAWVGAIAYTLQIYYDFSSYSDMAIGLGRMFGFEFKENFNYPYISATVTEFWRRWHISLSTWFREYVYFPLGGSRPELKYGDNLGPGRKSAIVIRNLFVVWMLTGIWHGADWTFILWGMWYLVFILLERILKLGERQIPRALSHIYLLFVVIIGWVFFRADNMREAMVYLGNMAAINDNGFFSPLAWTYLRENWLFFLLAILFSTPIARDLGVLLRRDALGRVWGPVFNAAYPVFMTFLYVVVIVYLARGTYVPFIYFNF